jgi:predicted transcriptional regulator
MSTKELAMETIRDLPEDVSWEQIEERIHFLAAIEAARDDVKSGKVVAHAEVSDLLASWITG